jgi:hypothetical protein
MKKIKLKIEIKVHSILVLKLVCYIKLPGPEETTDSILEFVDDAMFPRIEKVTTPATRQVRVFTMQVIMASLSEMSKLCYFH